MLKISASKRVLSAPYDQIITKKEGSGENKRMHNQGNSVDSFPPYHMFLDPSFF